MDARRRFPRIPTQIRFRRRQRDCRAPRSRRVTSRRWGAAAVEFAIIANIFFIMILACMEFARLNMVRNLAQDAAYYAARHVIVPGAISAEAVAEADRIMSSMLGHGYSIDVSDVNKEVNEVAVTVSVDLGAVAFFTPYFLPETSIETVARMRTERYDGYYEQ